MGTIWHRINLPNESKWAIVYCLDGAIYFGRVTHMSKNPEINDQDFFLEDAERLDDNRCFSYDCEEGVYFSLKNVSRVEFVEGQKEIEPQTCSDDVSNIWYPETSPIDQVIIDLIQQSTELNDKSL
jgi:hypothetical protein